MIAIAPSGRVIVVRNAPRRPSSHGWPGVAKMSWMHFRDSAGPSRIMAHVG